MSHQQRGSGRSELLAPAEQDRLGERHGAKAAGQLAALGPEEERELRVGDHGKVVAAAAGLGEDGDGYLASNMSQWTATTVPPSVTNDRLPRLLVCRCIFSARPASLGSGDRHGVAGVIPTADDGGGLQRAVDMDAAEMVVTAPSRISRSPASSGIRRPRARSSVGRPGLELLLVLYVVRLSHDSIDSGAASPGATPPARPRRGTGIFLITSSPLCRMFCCYTRQRCGRTHGKGAGIYRVFYICTRQRFNHRQLPDVVKLLYYAELREKTHGKVLCRVIWQYTRQSPFAVLLYAVSVSPCVFTRQKLCRVPRRLFRVFCIHGKVQFSLVCGPEYVAQYKLFEVNLFCIAQNTTIWN